MSHVSLLFNHWHINFICGSIDWIPSFKVAAAKCDQQCAMMWKIEQMLPVLPCKRECATARGDADHSFTDSRGNRGKASNSSEAPTSLRLQLLFVVDRPHCSIWLPVLQLINLVVRTIIDYNDNQSKTHCIWHVVYSKLNRDDSRPHDVCPYTTRCVRCQGRSRHELLSASIWLSELGIDKLMLENR